MTLRTLVVDDSPTALKMTSQTLADEGHCVLTASDGEEALEIAAREKPDLIVLDIILPKKNGFQVCRELKTDPATNQTKIVLLSSKSQECDKFWGLKQGADGYVTKPVVQDQLLHCIEEILAKNTADDEPAE